MTPQDRGAFFDQHRAKLRGRVERAAHRPGRAGFDPPTTDAANGSETVPAFRDDDAGYLAWLAANPGGFVANVPRGLNPTSARVHRASCWTINGEPARGGTWTGPYIKLCSPLLNELDGWAIERFGTRLERCGTCRPAAA